MIKLGIIGFGGMAHWHAENAPKTDVVQVVAAYDVDPSRLSEAMERGWRAYEDLERDGFIVNVPGKGCFVARQNTELVREEHLRLAQEHLEAAVSVARSGAISLQELTELLQLIYEDQ